ncbi:MAG: hypothetical protein KDN18_03025 [Verrucomicrobiae bacterium]|nr:hypothetical protein [Verrucomicrobiae bacterium]
MICFRSLLLALLLPLLSSPLQAWDPDDETFDPSIDSVIADGATRIGDPSPVYREGISERGFTHVGFSKSPEGKVTVQLSFIVPPDPQKQFFAALFLSPEEATRLAGLFRKGSGISGEVAIPNLFEMGNWMVSWDGKANLRVTNDHAESGGAFLLSIPAAKKLAGALEHSVAASAK